MGLCKHDFEEQDPHNPGFSLTEYDLAAKLDMTIRKDIHSGLYQIVSISKLPDGCRAFVYESKSLEDVVEKANELEKPRRGEEEPWIRIVPCSKCREEMEMSNQTKHEVEK